MEFYKKYINNQKLFFSIIYILALSIKLSLYAHLIPAPQPILKPPTYSKKAYNEIPRFLIRHAGDFEPRDLYELALLNIQTHNYKKAKEFLVKALQLDPHFFDALIQLGYLNLWDNRYQEAYLNLWEAVEDKPCDKVASEGLRVIAQKWSNEKKHQKQAFAIFDKLYECSPNNPDTLLSLGDLLVKLNKWDQAEIFFKKCLAEKPNYKDAYLSLANLYLLQKKWDLAQELYEKYPNDSEALKGLARLEHRKGNPSLAEPYYKQVLQDHPKDQEARKGYARALASSWKFKEAQEHYDLFLTEDPKDEPTLNELLTIKSHANPSLLANINYTASKENDPTLKAPVVRDFYLYSDLHALLPASDRLLFDVKGFFYHQKEVNIYNPGINYNAELAGIQLASQYLFKKNWRVDAYGRAFYAWPEGSMNFPFKSTTRFEPGVSLSYNALSHLAYLDLHVESFIIKNFTTIKSEVLGIFASEFHYLFRPDVKLHPQIEASVRAIKLFDGNFEDLETVWAQCAMPYTNNHVIGLYKFQHSHFNQLTPNYFSYRQQYCNFVGVQLHFPLAEKGTIDLIYEHNWQLTKKLIQPIGSFIFIANSQLLTGDKITGIFIYRAKDKVRLSLEGHYFRDTLPYRDWNVKGSLLWQF